MTTIHHRHLLALASAATLLGLPSLALAQDAAYPYGGISVGASRAKLNEEGVTARQLSGSPVPLTVTNLVISDNDTAYRAFLGYQFNRSLGLEASYFNLGHYRSKATTVPDGVLDSQIRIAGGGLDVVGTLPLSDNFSLLARVGGQYAKVRGNFTASGAATVLSATPSQRKLNYKAGVGLQYAFGPNFLLRAEADQYRVEDSMDGRGRVRVLGLSAVFPFGAGASSRRAAVTPVAYQPVAQAAPAPAPMMAMAAPTPAPAPAPTVVAAVPAPVAAPAPMAAPALRRVSFSAESLFGFDQSTIRPEGKAALDTFARDVAGTQFEVIVVEGHADRLGSTAYNQTLSLQRADAVKAYLVTSGGFDPAKVTTAGKGETAPTTKPEDCQASLHQAALRLCLQPDRRVDVEVNGTR